jgi:penicillin G amidase
MSLRPSRLRWTLALVAMLAFVALQACDEDSPADTQQDTGVSADTSGTSADTNTSPDTSGATTDTSGVTTDTSGATTDDTNADTDTVTPDELVIPGLSAPVQAVYDANGILHLTCQTDADCMAALGYFHAANRFFFMDFVRTSMRGRLSKLTSAGELVLNRDIATRRLMTNAQGQPLEEVIIQGISPASRAFVQRYSDGVNAWLADARAKRNGAAFSVEYDFPLIIKDNIEDWAPEDTAAFALYMFDDLSNNSYDEISLGNALNLNMPADFTADLFTLRPAFPVSTMGASGEVFTGGKRGESAPKVMSWDRVHARLTAHKDLLATTQALVSDRARLFSGGVQAGAGSNNWVVGSSRSTSGRPLLANDPHLALTNPPIWFGVEIDAKTQGTGTIHVAGGSIPGLPAIFSGHNEHIAWGVTTIYYDLADVYTETLNDAGTAVIFNGEEVAILTRDFTFEDHSEAPPKIVTQTFEYVPHHGVIVQKDVAAKTALTIKWVPYHEAPTDFDGFFNLMTATTVDEARQALAPITVSNQNFVVIDKDNNIGWFPMGKVPRREWSIADMPSWLPLPGDGSAEWNGYFAQADLPQMQNPTNDFIATANQDITGHTHDGDPANDGHGIIQAYPMAIGAREARIVELIEDTAQHTPSSMLSIQSDTLSVVGRIVVPQLLAATTNVTLDPSTQTLVDALTAWDYTCPTGLTSSDPLDTADNKDPDAAKAAASIGCSAFHATLFEVLRAAYADEMAPLLGSGTADDPIPRLFYTSQLANLLVLTIQEPTSLTNPDGYWDNVNTDGPNETREQIFLTGMTRAAEVLTARFGADSDDWRWGRIHTISLSSPFAAVSSSLTAYNAGPYANDGGFLTVDVATPRDRKDANMAYTNGASIRTVAEITDAGPRLRFQLPGGTSLDRRSTLFNQLMPNWLTNTAVPLPFAPEPVQNPMFSYTVNPPKP